jgi:hypothetical protein
LTSTKTSVSVKLQHFSANLWTGKPLPTELITSKERPMRNSFNAFLNGMAVMLTLVTAAVAFELINLPTGKLGHKLLGIPVPPLYVYEADERPHRCLYCRNPNNASVHCSLDGGRSDCWLCLPHFLGIVTTRKAEFPYGSIPGTELSGVDDALASAQDTDD